MKSKNHAISEEALKAILDAVSSLEYGQVQITVHDSRVVQIDKLEKRRLSPGREDNGSGI